jgi:hypothetical protein
MGQIQRKALFLPQEYGHPAESHQSQSSNKPASCMERRRKTNGIQRALDHVRRGTSSEHNLLCKEIREQPTSLQEAVTS